MSSTWAIGQFWGSIREFYKELNPATLTGAVDVIVVEQPNGDYICSPFHVRFGKMGVLRSKEKVVEVSVNDVPSTIPMKLSDLGEAFFVESVDGGAEVPCHLATSPLPTSSLESIKRSVEDWRVDKADFNRACQVDGEEAEKVIISDDTRIRTHIPTVVGEDDLKTEALETEFVPSSRDNDEDGRRSPSPARSETEDEKIQRVIQEGDALGKVLGQAGGSDSDTSVWKMARKSSEAKLNQKQLSSDDAQGGWNLFGFMRRPDKQQVDSDGGIYLGDLLKDEKVDPKMADRYKIGQWRKSEDLTASGAPPATVVDGSIDKAPDAPPVCVPDGSIDKAPDVGLAVELNPVPSPRSDGGYGSKPSSITGDDRRWFFDEGRFQELMGDVTISSCGGLDRGEITEELFNAHLISYDQLNANPDLLFSSDLVIRMNGKFYNWRVAGPMLVSLLLFQQPLSESAVNALINKHQPKPTTHDARDTTRKNSVSAAAGVSSYFWWRRATSADPPVKLEEAKVEQSNDHEAKDIEPLSTGTQLPPLQPIQTSGLSSTDERHSPSAVSSTTYEYEDRGAVSDSELEEARKVMLKTRYKKTLLLTSDQLKSLNLKRGVANRACFSVTTKYQGTTVCECDIFLWRYDDKIIISDIDGTITKSDVLGHILPRVGGGFWAHIGVAELFNRIAANDYKVLYLTARAIGMASQTKEYLQSIRQDRYSLPGGPLLLSPTSVFNALHREVIEKKPEIFKMSCLRDVAALFPAGMNPFYAGFGNRANDTVAYTAAGVPANKIYIIDPTGRVEFVDKRLEFSYPKIADLVDHIFPPLRTLIGKASEYESANSTAPAEFNAAQYWRSPLPDLDVDVAKFPKPAPSSSKASTKSSTSTSSIGWSKKK